MNDFAQLERLMILGALFAQIGAGFYWGGGLYRLVKEHERRLESVDDTLNRVDDEMARRGMALSDINYRLGKLEGGADERRLGDRRLHNP